jgi:hypothetical protein
MALSRREKERARKARDQRASTFTMDDGSTMNLSSLMSSDYGTSSVSPDCTPSGGSSYSDSGSSYSDSGSSGGDGGGGGGCD